MAAQGALLDSSSGGAPARLDQATVTSLVQANTYGIPITWFVDIIERETNFAWNEVDTDYDAAGNARALKTYGLCQLNSDEFGQALSLLAVAGIATGTPSDACDPATNIAAFCRVSNIRLGEIDAAVALYATANGATAAGGSPSDYDRYAYLAWAHNFGLPTVLRSIASYGCDWTATCARNGYGSKAIGSYASSAAIDATYGDDTVGYGTGSVADSTGVVEQIDDDTVSSGDGAASAATTDDTMGVSSDTSFLRILGLVAVSWFVWDQFFRD